MSVTNIPSRVGASDEGLYARHAQLTSELLFQGRWKVHILCVLRHGSIRFGQLGRRIPGASKKGLASGLRKLEADGIVVRKDLSETILHVEYALHEQTRSAVCTLLDELANWGDMYTELSLSRNDSH